MVPIDITQPAASRLSYRVTDGGIVSSAELEPMAADLPAMSGNWTGTLQSTEDVLTLRLRLDGSRYRGTFRSPGCAGTVSERARVAEYLVLDADVSGDQCPELDRLHLEVARTFMRGVLWAGTNAVDTVKLVR